LSFFFWSHTRPRPFKHNFNNMFIAYLGYSIWESQKSRYMIKTPIGMDRHVGGHD
jgi:hypothetical protein